MRKLPPLNRQNIRRNGEPLPHEQGARMAAACIRESRGGISAVSASALYLRYFRDFSPELVPVHSILAVIDISCWWRLSPLWLWFAVDLPAITDQVDHGLLL